MSERTLDRAIDHANYYRTLTDESRPTAIAPGQAVIVADLMLLAAEVERLRTETHQLRMIAIDLTPYLHLTTCEKCGQQKMCVGGIKSDGHKLEPSFECEDCTREIDPANQLRHEASVIKERFVTDPIERSLKVCSGCGPTENSVFCDYCNND